MESSHQSGHRLYPGSQAQSGQIAVVVLLLMVVMLVLGLSLATRTTQEVLLSQQTSETARVWNAAETGAEQALSQIAQGDATNFTLDEGEAVNKTDVVVQVEEQTQLETTIRQMGTAHIDLTGNGTSPVTIRWATEANCSQRASLVVSLYYKDGSDTTRVRHYPLGRGSCSNDNFLWPNSDPDVAEDAVDGYRLRARFDGTEFSSNDLFMRIKPVYADTDLRVSGGSLPIQGYTVTSRATNQQEGSGGPEQRAVQVERTLAAPPSILDFALYSGGSIVKN